MVGFWSPDADLFVWVGTPDGGLAIERARDDGQGNLLLSSGGHIRRQRIISRGKDNDPPRLYLAAMIHDLPDGLTAAVQAQIGFRIPDWLVAEMRLHLEDRVRAGTFILAGKRAPIAADAPWHRFDPASLAAWDFRMDNTAVPSLGGGDTYVLVTAFTPDQWQAARSPEVPPDTQGAGNAAPLKTGAPGRPTSMHLAQREHARRMKAGDAEATLKAEATHLAEWLRQAHPNAPPLSVKAIENGIRGDHRRHREKAPN